MLMSKFLINNYPEILEFLNCLKVGVFVTDGKGDVLLVNDESCSTGGLTRGEIVGKNMKDLEDIGFTEDTIIWKVLEGGKTESHVEKLGDGGQVYVTGTPLYDGNKIDLVICTERNIEETQMIRDVLNESNRKMQLIKEEILQLRRGYTGADEELIAEDEKSKALIENVKRIAVQDMTVMLTGESGTGKEVYAKYIYRHSNRSDEPFIRINCAAIPENLMESEFFGYEVGAFTGADKKGKPGYFEMANNGTLFLDEIGELPIHLQAKLLRVIQEKEVIRLGGTDIIKINVRLITATNKDLKEAVERGEFRQDLYYRLNIMPINIEPLRNRKKDIDALTMHFVDEFNRKYKLNKIINEEAMDVLRNFEWPGNVRELRNVLERIMISFDGDIIKKFQVERVLGIPVENKTMDTSYFSGKSLDELVEEYEKNILISMLAEYKKDSDIARMLKMNRSTLSRKLKRYGISRER